VSGRRAVWYDDTMVACGRAPSSDHVAQALANCVHHLDPPKYAEAVMPSTTSVGLPWPHVRAYFASQLEKQKAYRANNLEGLPRAADVYTQLVSLENDPNKHKGAAPLMWSRPRQSGGF
jgi:hypothetical protein